jgi:hypothetical protein
VTSRGRPAAQPADGLLNPVALIAVAVLLVNDHVLKSAWPGPITGKLSDLAGLAFFPLVILGVWEVVLAATGRWARPSARALLESIGLTGCAFALVKTTPTGTVAAGWVLGAGQWMLGVLGHVVTGSTGSTLVPAPVVLDPSDLLALPALLVGGWIGWRRLPRGSPRGFRQAIETAS